MRGCTLWLCNPISLCFPLFFLLLFLLPLLVDLSAVGWVLLAHRLDFPLDLAQQNTLALIIINGSLVLLPGLLLLGCFYSFFCGCVVGAAAGRGLFAVLRLLLKFVGDQSEDVRVVLGIEGVLGEEVLHECCEVCTLRYAQFVPLSPDVDTDLQLYFFFHQSIIFKSDLFILFILLLVTAQRNRVPLLLPLIHLEAHVLCVFYQRQSQRSQAQHQHLNELAASIAPFQKHRLPGQVVRSVNEQAAHYVPPNLPNVLLVAALCDHDHQHHQNVQQNSERDQRAEQAQEYHEAHCPAAGLHAHQAGCKDELPHYDQRYEAVCEQVESEEVEPCKEQSYAGEHFGLQVAEALLVAQVQSCQQQNHPIPHAQQHLPQLLQLRGVSHVHKCALLLRSREPPEDDSLLEISTDHALSSSVADVLALQLTHQRNHRSDLLQLQGQSRALVPSRVVCQLQVLVAGQMLSLPWDFEDCVVFRTIDEEGLLRMKGRLFAPAQTLGAEYFGGLLVEALSLRDCRYVFLGGVVVSVEECCGEEQVEHQEEQGLHLIQL